MKPKIVVYQAPLIEYKYDWPKKNKPNTFARTILSKLTSKKSIN